VPEPVRQTAIARFERWRQAQIRGVARRDAELSLEGAREGIVARKALASALVV
jgi:hypothetical protein